MALNKVAFSESKYKELHKESICRCFEKNNCGGLFVVHEIKDNNNNAEPSLGACAYLSKASVVYTKQKLGKLRKLTFEL